MLTANGLQIKRTYEPHRLTALNAWYGSASTCMYRALCRQRIPHRLDTWRCSRSPWSSRLATSMDSGRWSLSSTLTTRRWHSRSIPAASHPRPPPNYDSSSLTILMVSFPTQEIHSQNWINQPITVYLIYLHGGKDCYPSWSWRG